MRKIKNSKLITFLFSFLFINVKINAHNKDAYKVVIIGSGPAGLSAAIYCSRSQLDPLVIEGLQPGGQLTKASIIENWPGTASIEGETLINNMRNHAESLGTKFISSEVKSVDFKQNPFKITLKNDTDIYAHSVIICTGAINTKLGCPGEDKYLGKGIAICATCDAPLFKDKLVIVIGGNNAATREVNILTKFTNKIIIVNKGNTISGQRQILQKIISNPSIKIMNNTKAVEIVGNEKWVTGVIIENEKGKKRTIPAQGIFIALGTDPASQIFANQLELDHKFRINITNDTCTSVNGVFAAGDVTSKTRHQVPAAANFGYLAGMDAEDYLRKIKVI